MKTHKEKALELCMKYEALLCNERDESKNELIKQCAKIAVEEIIEAGNHVVSELTDGYEDFIFNEYWQEVKNELNKMS